MNEGLLLLRVVFGGLIAAHGAQKLFGWFGGYGLAGTGGFFESLGFRPGRLFALAAGIGETAGGLLLALGLLGPLGAAVVLSVMVVAAVTVHWEHGVFATNNGIELPLLYAAAAAGLALIGHGAWALDAALGLAWLSTPAIGALAIAAGIVAGLANVAIRQTTPAQSETHA